MKASDSEVIEMAWCDKTSFANITQLTGLSEAETIKIMRRNLKPSSFRLWRKRIAQQSKMRGQMARGQKVSGPDS